MPLHVEIVTPAGAALSAEADEVVVPGTLGELGVLPGHRPMLSGMRPGVLKLRSGGKVEPVAVSTGFIEVGAADKLVVLTEQCQRAAQVAAAAARRDLDRLDAQLKGWSRDVGQEFEHVSLERAWADARLKVAEGRRE
jgi:F-type H+-transporting ATPase subunit epsilon